MSLIALLGCADPVLAQSSVSLAPYISVHGAGAPSLSPDGKWVIFTTSVSGTAQLWKIPAAASSDGYAYWPDQLTFFEDGVSGFQWSPDGKQILLRKDIGGNERSQLYLMNADGSGLDTLSHNPKAIFGGMFSPDGKSIIYFSNERNEAFFDVFLLDLSTRKSRLLHQSDHQNSLLGISADNRWLFLSRDSGNANNFVYVKDLLHDSPKAQPRLLTPHIGDASYDGFHISQDAKTLYFFTDQDQEFTSRALIQFQDPKPNVHFRDHSHWDVDQDIFSKNDSTEVLTVDSDGISELTIFDVNGQKLSGPTLPESGFISNLQVSDNGSKIAFNFTSPREIGSIYVYDRNAITTARITRPNLAGLDPTEFVRSELIHYSSYDGTQIPAYLYRSHPTGRAPVIVMMHGGPENQERPWFNSLAQYFVKRGYSVLIPNVRGSTGYGKSYAAADNTIHRMSSIRDMEYSAHWLVKQPFADSTKLVIYGGSYGGFMSLAAMTMQSDLWAAGVDLFGIANFRTFLKNTGAWRASNRASEYGDPVKDSAFLVQISPITHVKNIKHPLFVYQGKNDPRVPYTEAEQIVDAVKKRGIPVEYILLPDEGHGLSKRENRIKVITAIVNFLDKNLK
jgi:dipeptidyl aminopeptidase/acylaminoacyl peptidase